MLKWINNKLKKRAYNRYMHSNEWKQLKARILKRDGYKCFLCDSNKDIEVHHLFYEKDLYRTKMYQCNII